MTKSRENPHPEKPHGLLDRAADCTGLGLQGLGWTVGRVSPKISRAARAIARTETAKFIGEHFKEGYDKGQKACLRAEAEKHARKMMAMGGKGVKIIAEQFVADVMQFFGKEAT